VVKIVVLMFVWGPAMLGYALGWLVHHPTDWTGPAVLAPIAAAITALTYRWGVRRLPTLSSDMKPIYLAGMIASALLGVVIFAMLALRVIG
jgi:hypothetical protein